MLGHLSEDVYPGSKYVRGNIILVLPYLSSVRSINISIAKWGWERRRKNKSVEEARQSGPERERTGGGNGKRKEVAGETCVMRGGDDRTQEKNEEK